MCAEPIDTRRRYFVTSGEFVPAGHPLRRFCEQPFHWECYAGWPQRAEFARFYVSAWVNATRRNPFWGTAHLDERVHISANPEPAIAEVSVRLAAIGGDIRVPLAAWERWLAEPGCIGPALEALERDELMAILPTLRELLPTSERLVAAIDWGETGPPATHAARR